MKHDNTCPERDREGKISMGGNNAISAPPREEDCPVCGGDYQGDNVVPSQSDVHRIVYELQRIDQSICRLVNEIAYAAEHIAMAITRAQ